MCYFVSCAKQYLIHWISFCKLSSNMNLWVCFFCAISIIKYAVIFMTVHITDKMSFLKKRDI